jgi:hypothetical protein
MNKIRILEMKKTPLLTILFTFLFMLTACGSSRASSTSSTSSTNGFRNGSGASDPLTPESKLALGTIKLEGTKQAVDSKMATNLLPLWQLLFQLNSSSSTAPQEVTAVLDQIKITMAPEQISTINSMTLTQADIFTVIQQQAQANGSSDATGPGTTSRNRGNGGGFVFGGGGPGGGGFPGGGFRTNGGTDPSTSSQTAAQAAQARQNAVSNLVINQVIRLLETKSSS